MILVNESLSKSHDYKSLGEKRYNRKMKLVRRALKEFIKETETHETLLEQEGRYMGEQRKKTEAYYASDPSNLDQ